MNRPRRSALYVPGSNTRAIEKARTLAADIIIIDIEDAVAPALKAQARAAAVAAVAEGGFRADLVVRVNALDTEFVRDDLAAFAAHPPHAVLIPKVRAAADLAEAAAALPPGTPLWAMVETAAALLRLDAIGAYPGLAALAVGPNDLAMELGATVGTERLELLTALGLTVAAARAHGLVALDGVCNRLDDADGFAREAAQGAALGFDGKTLLHPEQIDATNTAFSPSPAAVAWAAKVVAAFDAPENADKGVLALDGRMIERLHLAGARRALARAVDTDKLT